MTNRNPIPSEPRSSRRATAIMLLALVAVGGASAWLINAEAAGAGDEERLTDSASLARDFGIGACLRMARPAADQVESIANALSAEAAARDHLFPGPGTMLDAAQQDDGSTTWALWPEGAPADGEVARLATREPGPCLDGERGWAFGVTRTLLQDGADRLMERADFGSSWSGSIEVTFAPEDARVRSTLYFSGPLGISGSCWLDETPVVDPDSGTPGVATESGDQAGLAGIVACRRFEEELSEGGAGAQAMALFPKTLAAADSGTGMRAETIEVTDELLIIRGVTR